MNITKSIFINAALDRMWPVRRDFVGLTRWSNVVRQATIEGGGPADQVGCVRYLELDDGSFFIAPGLKTPGIEEVMDLLLTCGPQALLLGLTTEAVRRGARDAVRSLPPVGGPLGAAGF